jgi:hypothetical protein
MAVLMRWFSTSAPVPLPDVFAQLVDEPVEQGVDVGGPVAAPPDPGQRQRQRGEPVVAERPGEGVAAAVHGHHPAGRCGRWMRSAGTPAASSRSREPASIACGPHSRTSWSGAEVGKGHGDRVAPLAGRGVRVVGEPGHDGQPRMSALELVEADRVVQLGEGARADDQGDLPVARVGGGLLD